MHHPLHTAKNRAAERANSTLMESLRSMLYYANLPLAFWAGAVSTVVYLKNRSPTSDLKNITPYECWCKEKPGVSNIKVFGCKSYAHIPDQRRGKLDKILSLAFLWAILITVKDTGYTILRVNKGFEAEILFFLRTILILNHMTM